MQTAAFGANVSYYSTSGANANAEFKRLNLDELLSSCDIVSIHAGLNEKTRNLIGERELNLMKEGAILMNFGRGGIVDENAVARAIDERNLRFAADVQQTEPMRPDHPQALRVAVRCGKTAWAVFQRPNNAETMSASSSV